MLDGDHYHTAQLVETLISNAGMQAYLNLINQLNPELTINGSKYQYNYQNLIISEGDTVYMAMVDFWSKFHNQKTGQQTL
jgi:hypothetical protein